MEKCQENERLRDDLQVAVDFSKKSQEASFSQLSKLKSEIEELKKKLTCLETEKHTLDIKWNFLMVLVFRDWYFVVMVLSQESGLFPVIQQNLLDYINIYDSKSPLTPTGFRWDRQWLVVNSNGRAYTQRVAPKLALVDIELPTDAFTEGWKPTNNSYMVIKAPGMAELNISLRKPNGTADGVSVWEWSGSALDKGAKSSKWFSNYLGKASRLVRFNEGSP
ncbi:hypothetical protein POM88_018817 [Heracleum sosnowskyi]|uniref:Molybdenum cofactor sulfurase middle domain-containing protein n=1 Tax=Heracleum sosnowskyi TaxID=360622 RepID=A0AAD8IR77_9APIA|nr:hypothetical protein POM88_018817 [Heracleum sosnowskyi]